MASYVYAVPVVHFKLGFFKETARPDYIGLRVVSLDRPWCTGGNAIWCHGSCYLMGRWIHCRKRFAISPSPAGMSLIKLSLDGNNLIIPAQFFG
jgi:hypothetical protein